MTWFHPAGTLASGDADLVVTPDTAPWTYSGLQVFTLRPGATGDRHAVRGRGSARPALGS